MGGHRPGLLPIGQRGSSYCHLAPTTQAQKEKFYKLLAERLHDRCGVSRDDLIVSIVENSDADWSFGHGQAQFLTKELQ